MSKPSDFLVDGKWTCTKCGACCSFISPAIKSGFPSEWVKQDGSCQHLEADRSCAIYDTRPEVCRISNTLKGVADKDIAVMCALMKNHMDIKDEQRVIARSDSY